MVELPQALRTRPLSFYVWSRSRRAGHALAYAIGAFLDPEFRWLTLRESETKAAEDEAWVRKLLPVGRILPPLAPSDMREGPRVSSQTMGQLVRPGGPAEEREELEHFLLLPSRLQDLLDLVDDPHRTRAVVVANTDRIRRLAPNDPGGLRPFTALFSRFGLSVIATDVPPPFRSRYAFDIVLRLDIESDEGWRTGQIVVEKGLPSGDIRTGAASTARETPWYLEAAAAIDRAAP